MTTRIIAVLIAGLFAGASASALAQSDKIWISVGDAAYNCGFTTLEQCRATVSGVGGFCEVNRFTDEPVRAPAKRMRRSG